MIALALVMLSLVNHIRVNHFEQPLKFSLGLTIQTHAHHGFDDERVYCRGDFRGENTAVGYPTVQKAVQAWMNSPGHRENILLGPYRYTGITVKRENGILVYVQAFCS